MFRRSKPAEGPADSDVGPATDPAQAPKGRATPSRKEAEAARKAAASGTSDPKAARQAEKDARRKAQVEAGQALRSGDESRLPARDRGPIKSWVRDQVDGRISVGELFIPVAVLVLVLGFVRVAWVQQLLLWVWTLMLAGVIADSLYLWWRLRKGLAATFPEADPRVNVAYDKGNKMVFGTKGAILYGLLRSVQLRRLRLPKTKVRWNGSPLAR